MVLHARAHQAKLISTLILQAGPGELASDGTRGNKTIEVTSDSTGFAGRQSTGPVN